MERLKKTPKMQVRLWNLLVTIVLCTSVLLTGEVYFRFFVDTTDSFGLSKISQRWIKRHYQQNNYAWRDNLDFSLQKTSPKKRISFIGDSFTAGHGIKKVDDRFANLLRKQISNVEVHVLAANGFETIDCLETIEHFSELQYETDLVVLVYNLNDIAWLSPHSAAVYENIFSFNEQMGWLFRESYFLNFLAFRMKAMRDPELRNYYDYVFESYTSVEWKRQARALQNLHAATLEIGAELAVVTFPFVHNLKDYPYANVHAQLGQFWRDQGVRHLDLLPVLLNHADESLTVNAYDAHPNERAHELAAGAIRAWLHDRKLID